MKNVLLLSFFTLCTALIQAQNFEAKAQVSSNSTVKMTIRLENKIANVSVTEIPFDPSILSGVTDFANVVWNNERFTIPNDGKNYWLVPFQGNSAIQLNGGDTFCVDCFCKSTGEPQSAGCHLIGKKCGGSCGGCSTITRPCDGTASLVAGSFVIINADQVIF